MQLSSIEYGHITLDSVVPSEFSEFVLPGGKAGFAKGEFGKILFQKIRINEVTFFYNIYKIEKDISLDFRCSPGMMQAHVALKNDSRYCIQGTGDVCLAEGEYNVLDASSIEGTLSLEHDHEYRSFHVIYPQEYLLEFLPLFPKLEEWFSSDWSKPRLLFKANPGLTSDQKQIIDNILRWNYTDEMQHLYLELIIKEFLLLSLIPIGQQITPVTGLSRRSVQLIHESKYLLETTIAQQMTIAAIAKKLGIDEPKLKRGFRKIFGLPMSDYFVQTKMKIAEKLLLETNKPLKEIARLAGYSTKQSFLAAFKKYFDHTPGAFRKK